MAIQTLLSRLKGRDAWLVFFVALAVRLTYLLRWADWRAPLFADAYEYRALALSLLDRGAFQAPNGALASRMPGYPLFLAACYALFGRRELPVFLAECVTGAATCVLVYRIAAGWFERRWALAGGLFAAFYYDLFSTSGFVLSETVATALITLSFWFWARRQPLDARGAWAAGLAASAAYLVRPEFGPFVIIFAILAALVSRDWKPAGAILAALLFFAAPWTIRNRLVLGRPIATSTAGAMNVYLGLPRTVHERLGGVPGFLSPGQTQRFDALGELGSMDEYKRVTPGLYRRCGAGRLLRAWGFDLVIQYYPFLPGYDPTLIFLLPFWLMGLWLTRKDPRRAPLVALVLYLTAVYSVVAVMQARHRQVLGSALVLLALAGLCALRERADAKRFRWIVGSWAGVNLAIWAFAPRAREAALALRRLLF